MADFENLPLTRDEAWAILDALAQANRGEAPTIETQRRSWIADRILKLFPAARPTPDLRRTASAPVALGPNPVPFNPEDLTVRQAKECVETLKMIFDGLGRPDVDPHNLIHNMRAWRDTLARQWGNT